MNYHFTSNQGGTSKDLYSSLNIGRYVGDDPVCIEENRNRIKKRFDSCVLVSSRQIHKDRIYIVGHDPGEDIELDGYDALITACPDVALMVQLADCQGILLYDSEKEVIAAIHCGWRGNVNGIIGKTILCLKENFNSSAVNIKAFIGPSLGPCCAEFVNYQKELPMRFHGFQVKPTYFNFWEISKSQLIESGLDPENIITSSICTSCSDIYFSYRRACRTGDCTTGRHCGVISL